MHYLDSLALLLYVGPDQLMPITSGLAAIGGAILWFRHRLMEGVRRLLGRSNKP